jgi:chromosome partitioning protein
MHKIALLIQKGGSGKTTLAVSLATIAAAEGLTAMIVDLDPQANACTWHDARKEADPNAQNPLCLSAQPARLAAVLKEAEEGGVDIAFIDTPAKTSDAALIAAKEADLILVPCRPQAFDLRTIPPTMEIIAIAGTKPCLAILNDVPAQGDRHSQAKEYLQANGLPVCPFMLGHRACFGDAAALGKSAAEYEPKGKGAEECRNVYKYIIQIVSQLAEERKQNNGRAETEPRTAIV